MATLGGVLAAAVSRGLHKLGKTLRSDWGPSRADPEEFWALRDISFAVPRGQVLGIIGRNGPGKTTLLKIQSRTTPPAEGEATIVGRVGSLLEVGAGSHSELTGRENIYLSGTILGMKRIEIEQKSDEIVASSGAGNFIDTPIEDWSTGMYPQLTVGPRPPVGRLGPAAVPPFNTVTLASLEIDGLQWAASSL